MMRAAVLHAAPGKLLVEDVAIDSPGPDEVLIRVAACGLCHSDVHVLDGSLPAQLPSVLGHEAAGLVEAVGSSVTSVRPGDHVVTCTSQFCGSCRACAGGETWLCENRRSIGRGAGGEPALRWNGEPLHALGGLGGLAEEMLVHRNAVVAIPREVALDRAALLGCAVLTGVGSVINGARVEAGSTVAVIGCGGVGLNIVQGAVLAGAERVIGVDLHPEKLALAQTFGATDVIDAAQDPVAAVVALTGGGVDYAFEAIGLPLTIRQALDMIRPGRTAYVVGVPGTDVTLDVPGAPMVFRSKGLQGLIMGSSNFTRDIPMLARLYLQGRLKLDELVAERIPLDAVNQGYDTLRTGTSARSVVVFGE